MTKRKKTTKEQPETPVVYFNDILGAVIKIIEEKVRLLKARRGGAVKYGSDAMFVCAIESLEAAHEGRLIDSYLQAATYAIAAAMMLVGQWDKEFSPPQEEEEDETNPSA